MKSLILYYWLRWKLQPRWRSRDNLVRWQARQLKRFERFLVREAPYYQELKAQGFDIDTFPEVDKNAFMAHFNTMNTRGMDLEEAMEKALEAEREGDGAAMLDGCAIGLSTGTSGKRGLFLASKQERAEWAATMMHRILKPRLRRQRIAFILRANSQLYESIRSRLFEFRYFDLPRQVEPFLEQLNAYQPHVLAAQPSVLRMLATAQTDGTLHIQPEQIISYAEVLEPDDRQAIETAFGQALTEVYQATEGFIAATCSQGTLHLNEDIMRVERAYISGRRFQPILTDFRRRTQPVVRYRLNDILVEAEAPCACGSPMLAISRIEGRMDDLFILQEKSGDTVSVFPDWIRRRIVRSQNVVEDYVVIQEGPHHVSLFLACPEEDYEEVQDQIRHEFRSMVEELNLIPLTLTFHRHLPVSSDIKRRRIIRTYTT